MIVGVCFTYHLTFKTVKEGKTLGPHWILGISSNTKLCILTVLREYLHRTKDTRTGQRQLLLSYQKPHHPISNDTLARWVRDTLQRAGEGTLLFSAHSTRSACTSAAACRGLPIDVIMKAASWSAASTFTQLYKKKRPQCWTRAKLCWMLAGRRNDASTT